MSDRINIVNDILSRQLSWVSSADNKVPPVFAINAAMLGFLATLMNNFQGWTIFNAIVATLSILLLLGSVISLGLATFPRLDGPKGSLIYFGGIVVKNKEQYQEAIKKTSDEDFVQDVCYQIHRNAMIADKKFFWVKIAMIQTFVSFPFWIITIGLIS